MAKPFNPVLTKEQAALLKALIAQMGEGKPATAAIAANGKSERSIKNEKLTITAFKKAGFGKVTPHEDVLSFSRWAEKGMRPIEGTKAVKVKNLRLFHVSQVRKMTPEEVSKLAEDRAAYASRQQAETGQQATA